jgi:hypothetical protein
MVDHVAWGLLLSSLAGGSTTIGGAIGVGCCVLRMVVFFGNSQQTNLSGHCCDWNKD